MPYPIQSGSITDRLRKFFRIRGRTNFQLDEMVAPVVMVQDLTQGPYQAGVTPCAGAISWQIPTIVSGDDALLAIMLNDKAGSLTPILGNQFEGRSFSVTGVELQNTGDEILDQLALNLVSRADVIGLGVPVNASSLVSIQNNPGKLTVPVEMFGFHGAGGVGQQIWRGVVGALGTTPLANEGSLRVIVPIPSITIGPEDAILFRNPGGTTTASVVFVSIRGFYQEQPS